MYELKFYYWTFETSTLLYFVSRYAAINATATQHNHAHNPSLMT